MSERDALFQAVLDAPGDDAPRLVFADWLDENGEPERAELIRVQIEAARTPVYEPRYDALNRRADALIAAHGAGWRLPNRRAGDQVFRRGFVEEVAVSWADFQRLGDGLFRSTPLRYARFDIHFFLELEGAGRALPTRLSGADFGLLLPGDRSDWLGLAWPRLRWLKFRGTPDTVRELLQTVACPNLEALDLTGANAAAVVLDGFLRALRFDRLRAFALDADPDPMTGIYANKVRAGGARVLAECEGLATLTELHLANQAIGDAGLFHLASSPHLSRLEQLHLRNNEIGTMSAQNIEDFCASPYLTRLRVLDLSDNPLGPAGAQALSEWPGLRDLRLLDISDCELTTDAGRSLARSPYWHDRLRVRAAGNRFDPALVFPTSALA
ncbi:MAG TPA: TIGR02996 domain-containing protein [Gemmataceae bacterium]|nr:TIGR02996 domain-containing protein [Gemmataceae bacterium]